MSLIASRVTCPECATPGVRVADRIRTEFFGGYVVCRTCRTSLVINHRSWWFAAMVLGVEGFLAAAFVALLAIYYLRWWSAPLLVAAFVAIGVVVSIFSPLEAVDSAKV